MINLKGYNFLFGEKAVSPVIGTILMVAVTVIMAAIVGGFVYQTARPKVPPSMSSSLADDSLVATNNGTSRIAKLYWEGGKSIDESEFMCLVTYYDSAGTERTVIQDGASWSTTANGTAMKQGATDRILVHWVDSDSSLDVGPGDRLDFYEDDTDATTKVKRNSDFSVKVLHKSTEAFVADHTIRVY